MPAVLARLRGHRRLLAVGGAVGMAALAFVLWWFQPQALLSDRAVEEAFPTAAPTAPESGSATAASPADGGSGPVGRDDAGAAADPPKGSEPDGDEDRAAEVPAGPQALARGAFESRNRYTVAGDATVYELEDGAVTLRLEPFESTNGPDLYVYLTVADHAHDDAALDADHVDLGVLRGNIGNQSYDVPADVDLEIYDTVVIWCRRFSVSFGAADLEPAGH